MKKVAEAVSIFDKRDSSLRTIRKEENKTSNALIYLCAFLLPVLLLLMVFINNQIYPFGDHTVMTRELFDRFVPFFSEFQRKILQTESLFYTWNISGGINFWGVIGQYLSSPFNLLLLPFSTTHLPLGLTLLVLLRTGLSGLFMGVFIRKKEPDIDMPILLFFATAYSLCGYATAYFWAFMWIDAFVFLPLVILGVYDIIGGKKPVLFTLSLFLIFLSQYVMGLYVFIFALLIAGVFFAEKNKEQRSVKHNIKALLRLFFSGIISLGMASVIIFPTLRALGQSRISDPIDYIHNFYTELTLFDVGTRLFYGALPEIDFKTPNIYISMVALVLVPLYGLCVKIRLGERLMSISIALLLYVLMTSRVINYWFEGMRFTETNHFKYAFLLSFLLLYMGIRVVNKLNIDSKNHIVGVLFALLGYVVLFNQIGDIKPETKTTYIILLLLVLSVVLWGLFSSKQKRRHILGLALLILLCVELTFSSMQGYAYLHQVSEFQSQASFRQHIEDFERVRAQKSDYDFHRNVFINPLTENDGALFGVADIGGTYEMQNLGFSRFMIFLGMLDSWGDFDGHRLSLFTSQLMSVQNIYQRNVDSAKQTHQAHPGSIYVLDPSGEEIKDVYRLSTSSFVVCPGITIDQNIWVLPPERINNVASWEAWLEHISLESFYIPGSVNYLWGHNSEYDAEEGRIFSRFPGEADAFFNLGSIEDTSVLFFYANESTVARIRIKRQGRQPDLFREWTFTGPAVIDTLAIFEEDSEETTCRFEIYQIGSEGVEVSASALDIERFDQYLQQYQERGFQTEVWNNDTIQGRINSDQNSTLVLMVPYDTGWTALSNGKTVPVYEAFGGLLAVPIESGESTIILKYVPPSFTTGVALSLQSIMVFILLIVFNPFGVFYDTKKRKATVNGRVNHSNNVKDLPDQLNPEERESVDEK